MEIDLRSFFMYRVEKADCLHLPLDDNSVDLVFTSPPYEDKRTYNIDFKLKGQDWVDWAVPRYLECLRVCRGLVAWIVQGKTHQFKWSAIPVLLMAELHCQGVNLRCPPVFHRVGIPGSGSFDWWRNDYEYIICATPPGRLPWSDNTATGLPNKYPPGGALSHRTPDGQRINAGLSKVRVDGKRPIPSIANPGNALPHIKWEEDWCHTNVGGGVMGSKLAHENEAPFPEKLVEPFVKCFCPPDGTVLDPFCGSGTTLKVALVNGRSAIGYDIRDSQVALTLKRIEQEAISHGNPA